MTAGNALSAVAAAADTDVLVSLLALDCFHDTLACLGFSESKCFRLPSVVAQLERSRWVGDHWPKASRAEMASIVSRLPALPPPTDIATLSLLNGIDGVDEGEAYILTKACEDPGLLVLTGDGRMVRAIHRAPEASGVCRILKGRVVVFPQIVGTLVKHVSLTEIEYRWRQAAPDTTKHRHKGMSVMFGTTSPTKEDDFWTGQGFQLGNITDACGDGWLCMI